MTFPSFSAGEILRATDMNAVSSWLVKTQTVGTGVSSVTVTDAFSADYDHYLVTYTGGTLSGVADIALFFGSTRPANGYSQSQVFTRYDNGASGVSTVNNGTEWTFAGGGDTAGAFVYQQILNPFNSGRPKYLIYQGLTSVFTVAGSGIFTATASQTAFTLDPTGTTTMTGGTVRVYGYKK